MQDTPCRHASINLSNSFVHDNNPCVVRRTGSAGGLAAAGCWPGGRAAVPCARGGTASRARRRTRVKKCVRRATPVPEAVEPSATASRNGRPQSPTRTGAKLLSSVDTRRRRCRCKQAQVQAGAGAMQVAKTKSACLCALAASSARGNKQVEKGKSLISMTGAGSSSLSLLRGDEGQGHVLTYTRLHSFHSHTHANFLVDGRQAHFGQLAD